MVNKLGVGKAPYESTSPLRHRDPFRKRVKRYLPAREKDALIERIVKENCDRERVGVGELRMGGQRQAVSRVRGKIGWILSREYGISLAEIARRAGVCTSAIAKAIQEMERQILEV